MQDARIRMRDSHNAIQPRDRAAANAVESICEFDSLVSTAATEARSPRWAATLALIRRHRRDDGERPAYRYRNTRFGGRVYKW